MQPPTLIFILYGWLLLIIGFVKMFLLYLPLAYTTSVIFDIIAEPAAGEPWGQDITMSIYNKPCIYIYLPSNFTRVLKFNKNS